MNRSTRIAVGLLVPSALAIVAIAASYSYIKNLEQINPLIVLVMLAFILSSVASSAFTAYFFKGLTFNRKTDLLLVYLNAAPWVVFILLFPAKFWIMFFPITITPILGYWFGKRYFSL